MNQACFGRRKLQESSAAEVNNPALLDEPSGRAAVSYGYDDGFVVVLRFRSGDAEFGSQGEGPRGRGQFIGIEGLAVSHELAAVRLAVP